MSKETILEEKDILERKIADLCNNFISCRNIHIRNIRVNYGPHSKEWFPDNIISVNVNVDSKQVIPREGCDDDVIRRILKSEVDEK
jgi:hypothetical protein